MLFGFFDEKSVEGQVLQILSDEWPLTTTYIRKKINEKYKTNIDNQSVLEAVKKMQEHGVIQNSGGYFINHAWVQKWKIASQDMENKLIGKMNFTPQIIENKSTTIEFGKPIEIGKITLTTILELPNPEKKPFMLLTGHVWPAITLDKELLERFKELHKNNKVYLMCANDSVLDKLNAKAYTTLGAKIIFKPKTDYFQDTIVYGDYVCHVEFDEKIINLFDHLGNMNPTEIKLHDLFGSILNTDYKNKVIVLHNKELADKIRAEVLKEFGEM